MKHYKRAMSALHNVLMVLVSAGLVVMICVTAVEVVRRYLFGLSFSWAEELVKYLMIMVAFFGGAVAYQDKGLVALDMLTEKLPGNLQASPMHLTNMRWRRHAAVFCLLTEGEPRLLWKSPMQASMPE